MGYYLAASVIFILVNVFFLITFARSKSSDARNMALFIVGILLWQITVIGISVTSQLSGSSAILTFWGRMSYGGALIMNWGFWKFGNNLFQDYFRFGKKEYILFGLAGIITFSPLIITQTDLVRKGVYEHNFSVLYYVLVLWMAGVFFLTLFKIARNYLRLKKESNKKRFRLLIIGVIFSAVAVVFTNLLYPVLTGKSTLSSYGPFSLIILETFTLVALLKHKIWQTKLVLSEILLGGMGIIITIFLFLSGSWIELLLNLTTLVVFLVLASTLLREVLASLNRTNKLRRANKKLTETIEAKDNFLRMTSHQLRTPLTSLNGFLSMVVDKDNKEYSLDEKSYRDVIIVYINSQRLASVVNDILTVNAINAGRFGLNIRKDEDLEFIVQMILLERKSLIEYYNREVEYHKKGETFKADVEPTRFREIIQNLLDNAVIYAHEHILVELVDMPHDVRIIISDDGIGFTSYEKRKMTDRSYRGKEAVSRHPNGSGMGLFIVEKIVKAHQGNFKVHSEGRGRGTTVIVELPKKQNE